MSFTRAAAAPRLHLAAVLLAALLLSACATHGDVFRRVEGRLAAQQHEQALAELDALSRFGRDQALYQLNRGMLLRMQGDFPASIAAFERAKALGLDLEALSVTEGLAKLTVAEAASSYVPDPYERVLLHVYQALNFLEQGNLDAARVEALQLDVALRRLDPQDGRAPQGGDAFARYLSGLIFEAHGEWSDALIAYRFAARAYEAAQRPLPHSLKLGLLRLTEYVGLAEEHAAYRERFGIEQWESVARRAREAEVVVVLHRGLAPVKYEHSVMAQDFRSGQLYRVSLPHLRRRPPRAASFSLSEGESRVLGEDVEAVHALAALSLEQKLPGMTARAIARNVVKHNASSRAREENPLLGLIVNVAGAIAEQADTRSWRTLPDSIQIARLSLPPGEHEVSVRVYDAAGSVIGEHELPGLSLGAGQKRVVSLHWVN
jgi:uncharacterized protein